MIFPRLDFDKSTFLRVYGLIFWILYIITFIGIANVNIDYLQQLNIIIRTFISITLMYKFRPYWAFNSKATFTQDDWDFVFMASFYLFATTTLNSIITARFKKFFYTLFNKDEPEKDNTQDLYCKQFCK